jgi:hypothetical protein
MICPLMEPSFCAAAHGASAQTTAARKTTANTRIIFSDPGLIGVNANRFMLYSPVNRFTFTFPFVSGSTCPAYPSFLHPIISNLGRIPRPQRCAATLCR